MWKFVSISLHYPSTVTNLTHTESLCWLCGMSYIKYMCICICYMLCVDRMLIAQQIKIKQCSYAIHIAGQCPRYVCGYTLFVLVLWVWGMGWMPTTGNQSPHLLSEWIVRVGSGNIQIAASGLVGAVRSSVRVHLVQPRIGQSPWNRIAGNAVGSQMRGLFGHLKGKHFFSYYQNFITIC